MASLQDWSPDPTWLDQAIAARHICHGLMTHGVIPNAQIEMLLQSAHRHARGRSHKVLFPIRPKVLYQPQGRPWFELPV